MYRILIVHDVEVESPKGTLRWAYANRSLALQKYAPPDFHVDRRSHEQMEGNWGCVKDYDLLFNLDYSLSPHVRLWSLKTIYVCSFNRDSRDTSRLVLWEKTTQHADWVVVNNVDRWVTGGVRSNTCCISNGVDTDLWYATRPISDRAHKVLWTGGGGEGCETRKKKGYHTIMKPALDELQNRGFEVSFRSVQNIEAGQVMTQPEMLEWYNDGSYVICVAEAEGTPNYLIEGMACGCVPVSTLVGNAPEIGQMGVNQNLVPIERSVTGLIDGLEYAREHRERLSWHALNTIHNHWSYGKPARRADYYFALFRALIERGPKNVKPFCYMDGPPEEVC